MNLVVYETEHYDVGETWFEARLVIGAEMSYYMLMNAELPNLAMAIPYDEFTPIRILEELDRQLEKLMGKYMSCPVTELHKSAYPIRNWLQKNVTVKGESNGKK